MSPVTRLLAACTFAGLASVTYAEQPGPPDPASIVIPQPECGEQPPNKPPLNGTPPEMDRFNKRVNTYLKCVQAYALKLEDIAKQYAAVSQKYLDVGNKSISDINDYINEVKKNEDN